MPYQTPWEIDIDFYDNSILPHSGISKLGTLAFNHTNLSSVFSKIELLKYDDGFFQVRLKYDPKNLELKPKISSALTQANLNKDYFMTQASDYLSLYTQDKELSWIFLSAIIPLQPDCEQLKEILEYAWQLEFKGILNPWVTNGSFNPNFYRSTDTTRTIKINHIFLDFPIPQIMLSKNHRIEDAKQFKIKIVCRAAQNVALLSQALTQANLMISYEEENKLNFNAAHSIEIKSFLKIVFTTIPHPDFNPLRQSIETFLNGAQVLSPSTSESSRPILSRKTSPLPHSAYLDVPKAHRSTPPPPPPRSLKKTP